MVAISAVEPMQTSTKGIITLAEELRASLQQSTVLTPDSEGYAEGIKRWSDAVEKRAVGHPNFPTPLKKKLLQLTRTNPL